ncbi:MAG TPA: hypothetical protein VEQ66_00570 [Propionibacteriaceae bacterium]|nr:hypothetical protein [Propionibacteriaceae bacterium]
MTSSINDGVDTSDVTAGAVKDKECAERQEEMDAIAIFSTRAEFPPVAASYVQLAPGQATTRPVA